MILNDAGRISYNEWIKTTAIRNNVELGVFVIMPNHIHAIVRLLDRGELHSPDTNNELHSPDINNELHSPDNRGVCDTPRLRSPSKTIGAIVRGYKSSVQNNWGYWGSTKNYGNAITTNILFAMKNHI